MTTTASADPANVESLPDRPMISGGASVVIVVVCTLLGLGYRGFLALRGGVWRDEAQFLWIVRMPTWRAMLVFLRDHESHPPFFYALTRLWTDIFGGGEIASLSLPVLIGSAAIPATFLVGRRVFGTATGLVAVILLTPAFDLAFEASMARPYALMQLLGLAACHTLWLGLRGGVGVGNPWAWAAHAASMLALLLTHNWAFMVLAGTWAVALPVLWIGRSRSAIIGWGLAQAAVAIGYLPWLPTLAYQVRHAGHGVVPIKLATTANAIARALIPIRSGKPLISVVLLGSMLVFAAACVLFRRKPGPRLGEPATPAEADRSLGLAVFLGVPLVSIAAAVVLSRVSFLLYYRFLSTVGLGLLLVVSHVLATAPGRPGRALAWAWIVGLVGLNLAAASRSDTARTNARIAARLVAAEARPDDLVVVTPQWFASSFDYYFERPNPRLNYPVEDYHGAIYYDDLRLRLIDDPTYRRAVAVLDRARLDGRRVWFVSQLYVLDQFEQFDGPVDLDRMADPADFGTAITNRAAQIRGRLGRLYGPPRRVLDSRPDYLAEDLGIELYEPGSPGGSASGGSTPDAVKARGR